MRLLVAVIALINHLLDRWRTEERKQKQEEYDEQVEATLLVILPIILAGCALAPLLSAPETTRTCPAPAKPILNPITHPDGMVSLSNTDIEALSLYILDLEHALKTC